MGISLLLEPRIQLEGELVDLTSLATVKALARRLQEKGQHIDVLILNAGIGGWSGIAWFTAIWSILTDWAQAVTYPTYKLGYTGSVAKTQLAGIRKGKTTQQQEQEQTQEPPLGEVFTANVFGHYLLSHLVAPLMTGGTSTTTTDNGRIIWISSIEAYAHSLSLSDLQGLHTDASYESSKRLTDLLVLTSELPSTKSYVSAYLSTSPNISTPSSPLSSQQQQQQQSSSSSPSPPKLFLVHPGVCATSIAGLNPLLHALMLAAFYIARWLGSPWHPISPYLGACSAVWLALTPLPALADLEASGGKAKWGSSTDVGGSERVIRTEVAGWGWGGRVGERADGAMRILGGRYRGLETVTGEAREEFEETGRVVWREMEGLRREWEDRLRGFGEGGEEAEDM